MQSQAGPADGGLRSKMRCTHPVVLADASDCAGYAPGFGRRASPTRSRRLQRLRRPVLPRKRPRAPLPLRPCRDSAVTGLWRWSFGGSAFDERMTAPVSARGALPRRTTVKGPNPRIPLTEFLCISHEGKTPHSLARIYVPRDLAPPDAPEGPSAARLAYLRPPLAVVQKRSARVPLPQTKQQRSASAQPWSSSRSRAWRLPPPAAWSRRPSCSSPATGPTPSSPPATRLRPGGLTRDIPQ